MTDEDIVFRLVGKMVNEAIYCLHEKILDNPVDGDIGAVFGLGFPPFFGGPFRYVDNISAQVLVGKLDSFVKRYESKRFTPCPLLYEMAKNNQKFYKD